MRIVTSDNDPVSTSAPSATEITPAPVRRTPAPPRRRRGASILAGCAVVGFAAAIIAPAGTPMMGSEPAVAAQTAFSLAAQDAQNITVNVQGATASPLDRDTFEVYVTPTPTPEPEPASGGGGGGGGPLYYTGGGAPAEWMAAAGI